MEKEKHPSMASLLNEDEASNVANGGFRRHHHPEDPNESVAGFPGGIWINNSDASNNLSYVDERH